MKKQIVVVGAVILGEEGILCARRGDAGALPGMWEFPGGKVKARETPEEALRREIWEELDCTIKVGDKITTTNHQYDFGVVMLTTYYSTLVAGHPQPIEHAEIRWVPPRTLSQLEWAPADIPTVELISSRLAA